MRILLMILTIVAVLLLVYVLLRYLSLIASKLQNIGGDGTSYLAKLRLGLRAIESETAHLPPNIMKLNETLTNTAEGLKAVDESINGSIHKAANQKKYK